MARYLIQATYTAEGTRGLTKDGGSGRRAAVDKAVAGVGGKLESFYYAFGATDVFSVVDVPGWSMRKSSGEWVGFEISRLVRTATSIWR